MATLAKPVKKAFSFTQPKATLAKKAIARVAEQAAQSPAPQTESPAPAQLRNPDLDNAMGGENFIDVPPATPAQSTKPAARAEILSVAKPQEAPPVVVDTPVEDSTDSEPEPAPSAPSTKFSFAGAPTEAEIFGFAPPVSESDFSRESSIPQRAKEGAVAAVGQAAGMNLALMRQAQEDSSIPAGSHYEPWQWQALDKPGHITIEVHVDPTMVNTLNQNDFNPRKKATGTWPPAPDPFHPTRCLVSIPAIDRAPWGEARRIVLTPQTFKQEEFEIYKGRDKPKERIKEWVANPKMAEKWLHKASMGVIFGHCHVRSSKRDVVPEGYWVVLPEDDVMRYAKSLEADTDVDRARYAKEWTTNKYGKEIVVSKIPDNRVLPPAERMWGEVYSEALAGALRLALEQSGFVPPDDWPQEDKKWWKEEGAKAQAEHFYAEHGTSIQRTVAPLLERADAKDQGPRARMRG